jgi:hypothetical protein
MIGLTQGRQNVKVTISKAMTMVLFAIAGAIGGSLISTGVAQSSSDSGLTLAKLTENCVAIPNTRKTVKVYDSKKDSQQSFQGLEIKCNTSKPDPFEPPPLDVEQGTGAPGVTSP